MCLQQVIVGEGQRSAVWDPEPDMLEQLNMIFCKTVFILDIGKLLIFVYRHGG